MIVEVLPAPLGPEEAVDLAGRDVQVDAVHGGKRAVAFGQALGPGSCPDSCHVPGGEAVGGQRARVLVRLQMGRDRFRRQVPDLFHDAVDLSGLGRGGVGDHDQIVDHPVGVGVGLDLGARDGGAVTEHGLGRRVPLPLQLAPVQLLAAGGARLGLLAGRGSVDHLH